MITGQENFKRTIEFSGPVYIANTLSINLDWLREKDAAKINRIRELQAKFPDDMLGGLDVARNHIPPAEVDGVTRWVDEWGTSWADQGHGARPETYPLASGYDGLDNYRMPNPNLPERFEEVDRVLQTRGNRYVQAAVWFTLFERLWMLRGYENMLLDPYLETANFARLRDRIVAYNLAIIDHWIARSVDAVFFSDDWGTQRGLLIKPDDWRTFYKPAYILMFERVRSGGAHVWMHSCGDVLAILPDLIDIGLNVLNPVQPQAMDVHQLAREFGGKVCFNGGVDVQGTLIHGDVAEVKYAVHQLVEVFGSFDGGYIGGTSHTIMPETPLDNVIAP
jgi:hypothetical protein